VDAARTVGRRVDAQSRANARRELSCEGFAHAVARGASWFWDTLVDADLAQNTLGWQWTAGCGAEAAPYFRVFNPTSQGEKFDSHGDYVRRWCPELAVLSAQWIHQPQVAPPDILRAAGVELEHDYPEPIVNHAIAREVALEAFARIKFVRAKSP